MFSHRRFLPASVVPASVVLAVVALLAGCGSVNHNNPGPSPTPTPTPPGATPSPTPVAPSPSPTPPGPTPSPSPTPQAANAITGRVVDPSGAPVVGTVVVDLELGGGDFFTFRETTADAQGNFRFNNVPPLPAQSTGYAIMVAARNAHDPGNPVQPGSFYAPALLLPGGGPFGAGDPIVPGTNVGTIQLRFTGQGDIEGNATSTDSSQQLPIPIHVKLAPMRIFTLDFVFDYPWIGPAPSFSTAPGASCPTGTACGAFQLPVVPEDPVEQAIFSKSGYTFSPSQTAPNFILTLNAFSLLNGKPDCNPSSVQLFANTLHPDAGTNVGTAAFTSCQ